MSDDDSAGPTGWQAAAPAARRTSPAAAPTRRRRRVRRRVSVPRSLLLLPLAALLILAGVAVPRLAGGSTASAPLTPVTPPAPRSTPRSAPHSTPRSTATPVARPTATPSAAVVLAGVTFAPSPSPTSAPTRSAAPPPAPAYTPAPPAYTPTEPAQPTEPTQAPTHRAPPKTQPTREPTGPVDPRAPKHTRPSGPVANGRLATGVMRAPVHLPSSTRPWRGFRIRHTGRAGGDWIGGYRLGGKIVYRYQPGRRGGNGGYRDATSMSTDLAGRHAPTRKQTAMAAWILTKYGTFDYARQAAAVDAALATLLAPAPWHLSGRLGSARLAQSGDGPAIRSWARQMLAAAHREAGRVRLTLRTQDAQAGAQAVVEVALRNTRTGRGLSGYAVRVSIGGKVRHVRTNRHGRAVLYPQIAAGTTTVRAKAAGLPEWRVAVRRPFGSARSRVAVAGLHAVTRATATLSGVTTQSVSISAPAARPLGSALGGSYTVTGGQDERTVSIAAYGPFDGAAAAACTGTPAYTAPATTISADGTESLPSYSPTHSGFYVWSVAVAANASSTATSACGKPEAVRVVPRLDQQRDSVARSAAPGDLLRLKVGVSGFDRKDAHTLTTWLYGPYRTADAATCGTKKRVHRVTAPADGNGTVTLPGLKAPAGAGYYAFESTLDAAPLAQAAASGCGVVVHVTG